MPQELPPLKIELKFILEKVSIMLQEIKIAKNKNYQDKSARNLQPSLRIKKPLITESATENNFEPSPFTSPFKARELTIKEIIDVGLVGLKGKI